MSKEHLRPNITSRRQAQEMGSKGGKSRSLAKKLANRTLCNSSCPIWVLCWAKPVAQSRLEKEREEAKKKGIKGKELGKIRAKCALKEYPPRTIERAAQILTKGEPGFEQEIMTTMLRLGNDLDLDRSAKAKERYLYQLRENKKSIFGDKKRIQADIKTTGLTADDLADIYGEVEDEDGETEEEQEEPESSTGTSVPEGGPDSDKKAA